jgi:wyosine [tRNA(Phe)-imidazoG37] synthetase (radical SAM superfamily)
MKFPRDDVPVTRDHRRQWRDCLYVYPVISRRAKGLSIGVNLNPDKRCTFSCLYCQINRRVARDLHHVDVDVIRRELSLAMHAAVNGELWSEPRFAGTPETMRRINDIALSGDGEPTCLAEFDRVIAAAAAAKREFDRDDVKTVVITNASKLDSPQVRRALPILDASNGEIWAKLDAGTDAYFQRVNRPHPPLSLDEIVANIAAVAKDRPIVIQTLWFRINGKAPPESEIAAYCERLREILAGGGRIRLVQLHTIARSPQEAVASTLPDADLDTIAGRVRAAVPPVNVEVYYGSDVPPQQP